MCLSRHDIRQKALYLLNVFETKYFQNSLPYNRKLNLVFEFCDYINQMPDWQLAAELESDTLEDAQNFRKIINSDIDYWLGDLLKTIWL